MKESAFDCNIHAKKNDIQIDKWRCYQWAYNLPKNTEVYKANINDEQNHMQHKNYEKEKNIKGKIVEIMGMFAFIHQQMEGTYTY